MSMKIFDPTAPPAARSVARAPRPASLSGLRVGLVENTKYNSETLLRKLAMRLGATHGMTLALVSRKRSPSHEVDEVAQVELVRAADVAISGIGD